MIKIKKVNDIETKKIKTFEENKPLPKSHQKIFGNCKFGLVGLIGPRGLGKTTMIYHMAKNIIQPKHTKVYVYSTTCTFDKTMTAILDKFDKSKVSYELFTEPEEFEQNIEKQIEEMKENMEDERRQEIRDKSKFVIVEYCVIIDDMGGWLRNKKWFSHYVKTLRHYTSFIFLATQSLFDCDPLTRDVMNFVALFKNITLPKLKNVYESKIFKNNMSFDEFYSMYDYVTNNDLHQFLFINVEKNEFRINLNKEIEFIPVQDNGTQD